MGSGGQRLQIRAVLNGPISISAMNPATLAKAISCFKRLNPEPELRAAVGRTSRRRGL
jgi:hypothetical protein